MYAHTASSNRRSDARTAAEGVGRRLLDDYNAALLGALIAIGDRNDLFAALAEAGPVTVEELAHSTGQSARYLGEWLAAMVCAGYVTYEPVGDAYQLPPAVASWLTSPGQEGFAGLFGLLPLFYDNVPALASAFVWGTGVPHSVFGEDFHLAFDRFSRPLFMRYLVSHWIGAIDGLDAKLRLGGSVADVGCGAGGALFALAAEYTDIELVGYDCSGVAIDIAPAEAAALGMGDRIRLEERDVSQALDGTYDLICASHMLHAAVEPSAVLTAVQKALTPTGTVLWIELDGAAHLGEAREQGRAVAQLAYSMSVLYGLTVSLADGGAGLGALSEERAESLARRAGFTTFRRLPPAHSLIAAYELRP